MRFRRFKMTREQIRDFMARSPAPWTPSEPHQIHSQRPAAPAVVVYPPCNCPRCKNMRYAEFYGAGSKGAA
jgi:hypothetical protein